MSEFPYIHEIVEHLSVERKKKLDNAILGEIKEIIKDNSLDTVIVLDETAIVNALKKQIPKKPDTKITNRGIDITGEYDIDSDYLCPFCECVVGDCDAEEHFYNYCPDCGQALDWSDTE
jgi:hypothetical protein